MARIANDITKTEIPDFDCIQPFQLELSGLRGRVVKLGPVLDEILTAHAYPECVAKCLAEAAVLTVALSSMLDFDGIFTLQTSSDGALSSLVTDVTSTGDVRAYAAFDAEKLTERLMIRDATGKSGVYDGLSLSHLVGTGYLAFTVDQGPNFERYQGIVGLDGATLGDSIQHYFSQSEQLATSLRVASALKDGKWQAGAILLQHMPQKGQHVQTGIVVPFNPDITEKQQQDWERSHILLQSTTSAELANGNLHSHDLLYRLFHEEGIRIYEPTKLQKGCRCTPQKLRSVIATLPAQDQYDSINENGTIDLTCAFCSKTFHLNPKEIEN